MSGTAIYLQAIGVQAPGLSGWQDYVAATAETDWAVSEDWSTVPFCLSPRQAKRLSGPTLISLACAEQIGDAIGAEAGWVFASSLGEGLTLDVILQALSEEEILISPMKFQNAVHNAAVGQWTIAKTLQGPSTSIAAFDDTAGAGLLKAWMQCSLEQRSVGLVVYDWPLSGPLLEKRPMSAPLAVGMAFSPVRTDASMRKITCRSGRGALSACRSIVGEAMFETGNPVGAMAPVLDLLASGAEGSITLGLSGGSRLLVEISQP